MTTSKIIGIVLIAAGLALGYMGITKIADNSAAVKVVGIEINVSDEGKKQEGYLYLGAAAVLFAAGIYSINKKQ
jgi:hypothetical protein